MPSKKKVGNRLSGYKADIAPGAAIPNWDDIRVFVTVARSGSYRRAARELQMTQPSISHRIARFEAAVGAKLFHRSSSGAELTADGQRVLNHASSAELSLTKAVLAVRNATENAEGECKLGVGDGLGGAWVPRFMPAFLTHNPNVKLSLFTTSDRGVSKKPLFDLQIQYQEPLEPHLVVLRLAELHFTLFASRSYVEKYGSPASQEDLVHHRVLDLSLALTDRGTLSFWAGVSNKAVLFTNSSLTLAEAVWAGAGIGLLPTYAAAIGPELVAVLPQLHFQAPVNVCFEREMGARPAVRATLNFLRDCMFNGQAMPWFAENFRLPEPGWHNQLLIHLARLGESHPLEVRRQSRKP
jgi:DNA-binding transcriptional LysR family regulator